MKRVTVTVYAHMRCDTPLSLYAPVYILDDPLHSHTFVHT